MRAWPVALAALSLIACSANIDPENSRYPVARAVAVGAPIPDFTWDGVALHDYFNPAAARPDVVVLRVMGGPWCGTCRWHAAHTGELLALPDAERLHVVDLVLGDADNVPARAADLPAWRALLDAPDRVAVVADPGFSLRPLVPASGAPLPLYAFVETKGMTLLGSLSNPGPETLANEVDRLVSALDHRAPRAPRAEERIDGFYRRDEWDLVRAVTLPGGPPPDPTNAYADSPAAAALGRSLFEDAALSPSGTISCATCHVAEKGFADDQPLAKGIALGTRHTPRIALASFSRSLFWDGRADSLWSQALAPIENPIEMGSSRAFVADAIRARYAAPYEEAFGRDAATEETTRVFVDVGKAIEAYERTLRVAPNRLDRYVSGDLGALDSGEKQGLSLFAQVGCFQCHWGPRLTDDAFHVTHASASHRDRGRLDGATLLAISETNSASRWSDAPRPLTARTDPSQLAAFKTPSLRGVANAKTFGHDGSEVDLVRVTELYGQRGIDDPAAAGALEPWLPAFPVTTQWSLAPFLEVLE